MNEYQEQAMKFLEDTDTIMKIKFKKHGLHFPEDKCPRDIYTITLTRGSRKYSFDFGQSIMNSIRYADKHIAGRYYFCNGTRVDGGATLTLEGIRSYAMPVMSTRKAPTEYDILTSLSYEDFDSFEDFCDCFGYDSDSRSAEKIYHAIKEQSDELAKLYNDDELDMLNDIQ